MKVVSGSPNITHQQVDTAFTNLYRCDHGHPLRASLSESFYTDGGGGDGGHFASANYTTSEGLNVCAESVDIGSDCLESAR